MAFVVAVAQQKGGSGESTVAANLAAELASGGRRVALLGTDPQGSVTRWHAERRRHAGGLAPLFFDSPSGWRVSAALDRLRRGHDVVVLDTPPHAGTDAKVAIRAADLLPMPVQPSPADLWAGEETRRLAAEERRPLRALFNRVPAQGKMRDRVAAAFQEMDVHLLQQHLRRPGALRLRFPRRPGDYGGGPAIGCGGGGADPGRSPHRLVAAPPLNGNTAAPC